jgi:hypothetical protein
MPLNTEATMTAGDEVARLHVEYLYALHAGQSV